MVNKIELPEDPKLAGKILDAQARSETRRQEMGWGGKLFGNANEKPGNIAGFAILFSILMIAALVFLAPSDKQIPFNELYTLFGGIISLPVCHVLFGPRGCFACDNHFAARTILCRRDC